MTSGPHRMPSGPHLPWPFKLCTLLSTASSAELRWGERWRGARTSSTWFGMPPPLRGSVGTASSSSKPAPGSENKPKPRTSTPSAASLTPQSSAGSIGIFVPHGQRKPLPSPASGPAPGQVIVPQTLRLAEELARCGGGKKCVRIVAGAVYRFKENHEPDSAHRGY